MSLSEAQVRLRQQLQSQADRKRERISEILNAKSSVEEFMSQEGGVRPEVMEADGGLFMFSTLPVL